MEGVAGHIDILCQQALRELEREHDLRELALAVRTRRVVATLEHDVVEVDRRLPRGGDVDDTRGHGATKQRQEKVREEERGEEVDGEQELVVVCALLA